MSCTKISFIYNNRNTIQKDFNILKQFKFILKHKKNVFNKNELIYNNRFLIIKEVTNKTDVTRRVGRDDIVNYYKKTKYKIISLNNNYKNKKIIKAIKKSSSILFDFEYDTEYSYANNSSSSYTYKSIDINKSKLLNELLFKLKINDKSKKKEIKNIFHIINLFDIKKKKANNYVPVYNREWYLIWDVSKLLVYIYYNKKSLDSLVISNMHFWTSLVEFHYYKIYEEYIYRIFHTTYKENKELIDEFIEIQFGKMCFKKMIAEMVVSVISKDIEFSPDLLLNIIYFRRKNNQYNFKLF